MILRTGQLAAAVLLVSCALTARDAVAQSRVARTPLATADVDDIIALARIEDRRNFDSALLKRISSSTHHEVRRRAALTIARLYDWRGRELLRAMRADPDTEVVATVVWATGQLLDTASIEWIDSLLQNARTPVGIATEGAFGKIRTPETLKRLSRYLVSAASNPSTVPVVSEALLSIGRHDSRESITSITKWAASPDAEVRLDIEAKSGRAASAFFTRFPESSSETVYGFAGRAFGPKTLAAWGTGRPLRTTLTDADYRRIVEELVVPAYNGATAPRLRWETTRGVVDTQLNALDAPFATNNIIELARRGAMRNIVFARVIPNFVAQQNVVLIDAPLQHDEISRGRLVRGNLSWGSNIGNAHRFGQARGPGAAYDTCPAVYTFGIAPQPHNEGDFTALGRIINGIDVADRMQLGDVVVSVRLLKAGEK